MTQHLVTVRQSPERFNEPSKALERMVELTVGFSHLVFWQTENQISCNDLSCECRYCSLFVYARVIYQNWVLSEREGRRSHCAAFLPIQECTCVM